MRGIFGRRFCTKPTSFTADAEELFSRFAGRHQLSYRVVTDAPIEVCWRFPEQSALRLPITLALQNIDELNFGVGNFWSYFFPYPRVSANFEATLDAWVEGRARIILGGYCADQAPGAGTRKVFAP